MKSKIARLNALYKSGDLSVDEYRELATHLLNRLDWMARIRYQNMLFVSI